MNKVFWKQVNYKNGEKGQNHQWFMDSKNS